MPRLRCSAESKEDLKQIARFIARDKPAAARRWLAKLREKCRLVANHPDVGDARPELGENIRSTYVGSYVIFFRHVEGYLEIVRVIRGDVDDPDI
ncbi:type II toxin-antitoxin system RelE/ParE family toxin [Rhodopirellula sp. JC740]|uniref:Type II toxin-antitoxin system RelE/ParE family toxin n=1 Tax=Rhodopirellula halodulae TaxID=2894198 RepID=A0ABS8NM95_9BACT|nr:type II toxin-antitoxin system RelE/ParE family toxin [Rhodopirellula sp. JC740]MCC9644697.1 type II toxin-antitoxin system RelE/ParE family toxin [Rhodopirellula sp. JC740]